MAIKVTFDENVNNPKVKVLMLKGEKGDVNLAQLNAETTARENADTNLQSQINGLASGSPLVASSTSGMTDTTRVYVNTTDGKWYYYDGDSWEIGGTYQASEDSSTLTLLDEHLEPFKVERLNLINPNGWTDGKYVNENNGNLGNSGSFSATDYILLEANTKYHLFGFNNPYMAFYDLNKSFIPNNNYVHADANTSQYKYVITDVDCYFRATTNLVWKTYNYISKYVEIPESYNNYGLQFIPIYNEINKRGKATGEYNLFNRCGHFGLSFTTGKPEYNKDIITSDLIPIENDVYWTIFNGKNGDVQYIFEYDEDKNFIKSTVVGGITGHLSLDNNTRYIRTRSNTTSSSYTLPDVEFYNENLLICDNEKYLIKYIENEKITNANDVSYDFFKSSATFKRDFIKTALDNYINTIKNTGYDLVIPMMTDLHDNQYESYSMLNYLASDGFADICFNLGDNIPEHFSTRQEAINFIKNYMYVSNSKPRKSEIYVLRGNHDTNPTSTNPPTQTDINKMIDNSLYYSLAEFRTKKGLANSNCNYGYIDTNSKVRLIFLDTSDIYDYNNDGNPIFSGYNTGISQKQLDWFCNKALNFMNKEDKDEWSVIIFAHDRLAGICDGFAAVLEAFMSGTSAEGTTNITGRTTNPITLTYDVDFTNQGAMEFICAINGHLHEDNDEVIGETGRKQISIACDNAVAYHYVNGTKTAYTRTKGTIEEHLIDTLCLDKKNKIIYMKRLGVGTDRTYNY